jgi:hypothetical protein
MQLCFVLSRDTDHENVGIPANIRQHLHVHDRLSQDDLQVRSKLHIEWLHRKVEHWGSSSYDDLDDAGAHDDLDDAGAHDDLDDAGAHDLDDAGAHDLDDAGVHDLDDAGVHDDLDDDGAHDDTDDVAQSYVRWIKLRLWLH